jgi:hypothetical protein
MANVASLCPVNLPLVAVPSAHSVWSPIAKGLLVWLRLAPA